MARVYKPRWTKPLSKNGRFYTKDGVRYCDFLSRGKKTTGQVVVIDGVEKLCIESPVYYCEYRPFDRKKPVQVKSGPDRRNAESHLARLLREDDDRRVGRHVPDGSLLGHTLSSWKKEYLEVLKARDLSPEYIDLVDVYLEAILAGCRWHVWADVNPDRMLVWLARKREETKIGPATVNSYIRVAKGFSNWLAGRLKCDSPLRGKVLPFFNEEVDRRRSKRMLSDSELAAVIEAAERCPRRATGFGGVARALLYRMAAYSGLRASELAALTPRELDLEATPPHVRPLAGEVKARRDEPLPLPADLVEALKAYLAGRDPRQPIWPGRWAERRGQSAWLRRDLARAGIPARDDRGRNVTFHSFRRRFTSKLIDAGVDINRVKRLSRHKDLDTTLTYYTDADLPSLGEAVERIPKLPPKPKVRQLTLFDDL